MKRILAFVLCFMTVCTLLPVSALAEGLQPDTLSYNGDGISIDARSPEEMATMSLSQLYEGADVLPEGETDPADLPADADMQVQEESDPEDPPADNESEDAEEPPETAKTAAARKKP